MNVLVRALNFEQTLRSTYPDTVFDNTGFYPKMRASITVSDEIVRPGLLCDTAFNAQYDKAIIKLQHAVVDDYTLHETRTENLFRIAAYQEAVNETAKWISVLPKVPNLTSKKRARAYAVRGQALGSVSQHRAAADAYETALKYDPNDAITLFGLLIPSLRIESQIWERGFMSNLRFSGRLSP